MTNAIAMRMATQTSTFRMENFGERGGSIKKIIS
jgi:hypothetical protein